MNHHTHTPYSRLAHMLAAAARAACMALAALALQMCSPAVPDNATAAGKLPAVYPDYTDITIPANIAPLNFDIEEQGDGYITRIHTRGGDEAVMEGAGVRIDPADWSRLLEAARGDTLYATVYVSRDGAWHRFDPLVWEVAEDIDPWISYRQIEPSYVNFETMRICQRSLTDFDEREIYNNRACADGAEGQCVNCHSYQDYNRGGNMQMHLRIKNAGTLIVRDGQVKKVPLKGPGSISAGVYPSWHPTLPLIAYSNNITRQAFHNADHNKIEVYDNASDLILYDVDRDVITPVADDPGQLETFPYWNHDGTALYYASAPMPPTDREGSVANSYGDIRYDILRMPFDAATRTFGTADTVFRASAMGLSASLPRESPDGRYLLMAAAPYGTFHIWHHDADLWLHDLQTGESRPLDEVNSPDTESYHSWSSNGRWILFSSRRDDGSYTRLYIAYFDKDGRARKAFLLPQEDPAGNSRLFKSYNVPEFMVRPVEVTRSQWLDALGDGPE